MSEKPKISWEWESKKDVWVKYNGEISKKLESASENEEKTVDFSVEKSNLQVDLERMIQKNKTTGFERKVRLTFKGENDLDKMEQKNDVSGICRPVRRIVTSSEHASTAAPAPPARMTRAATASRDSMANGASSSKKKAKEEQQDDDEDVKPPPAKKGKSSVAKSVKSGPKGKSVPAPTAEPPTKKVVMKGKAPVDPECSYKLGKSHVYFEGKDIYDVMLNQTNLQNNNNKYYVIQLLEDDNAKSFSVWQRWGRVGFKGQHNLVPCGPDLEQAKKVFCQKFADKTKNDWSMRQKFKKVAGKYDLIKVDYSADNGGDKPGSSTKSEPTSKSDSTPTESEIKKEPDVPEAPVESKLDPRIQALLNLICDIQTMSDTVTELEYDTEKLPLGKLTSAQIKAGFSALKKIEGFIEQKDFGARLLDACNDYYTRIPHCFGMRRPPLIRDREALKKELKLVEALGDIEIAIRVLKRGEDTSEGTEKLHPVDRHYKNMECDLKLVEPKSKEYTMVEKYMENTHAATHKMYKMKIKNLFECEKRGDEDSELGNKMLLWHGSRLTNWYGILSQGLRIAPPEAPVTGYMFGKGLYFADMSSKSANYCFATPQRNTGLVMLCEVALGKTRDLVVADYKADKLPTGYNSTRGLGMYQPDPKDNITMEDGCVVPQGTTVHTGVENPKGYTLNYNEFVVYDRKQVKMKYLVEVDFQF